MFVFWYCHKRGKEVRLAKEAETEGGARIEEEEDDDTVDEDDIDDPDGDEAEAEEKIEDTEKYQQMLKDIETQEEALSRPALPPRPGT